MISFDQPRPGATFERGQSIAVAVSITSNHRLSSVRADVTGALNFQFPAASPDDSSFNTILRVGTVGARGDSILVTVEATDVLGNRRVGRKLIRLR